MSENILKGPVVADNVRMGFGEYFWRTTERFGERIFQIDAYTGQQETFFQVRTRAVRMAIHLKKMGLRPKDVVMVCSDNDLDDIVPVLAASFLGAYVTVCLSDLEYFLLRHIIESTTPKVIFSTANYLNAIEQAVTSLRYETQLYFIGETSSYPTMYDIVAKEIVDENSFLPFKVDIRDPAFIAFSSGTTSTPKGVYLTHLAVLAGSCRMNGEQDHIEDSPVVSFYNLYWISSIWLLAYNVISAQPRIVGPKISTTKFLELVEKYKIKHVFLGYSYLIDLVNLDRDALEKYNLSSIEYISMGGTQISPAHIEKMRSLFKRAIVFQNYGGTEMGCVPTRWDLSDMKAYKSKSHSLGKVNLNVEIKIADIETGKPLGPHQQGEIMVKSPYSTIGYCTQEDISEAYDRDGFIRSGDVGYYDEEGYLYYTDRVNEIFKYRGHRIYPTMVEMVLKTHPAIQEAVAFGIMHDRDMGQLIACVTLKDGVTEKQLDEYVVKNMGDLYRVRGGFKIVKHIPQTANGKVARKDVKRLFLEHKLNEIDL